MKKQPSMTLLMALGLAVGCGAASESDEAVSAVDPLMVSVTSGAIAGAVSDIDASVRVFKGVPFAAPPVGDLRWRPPQPVEPWVGTRDAMHSHRPVCRPNGAPTRSTDRARTR